MWQPKQPASEVVATLSLLRPAAIHVSASSGPGVRRAPRSASRRNVRSPIGTAKPLRFCRMTPTGQTCAALSASAKSVSPSWPDLALTIRCVADAAPGEREDVLAVDIAAGAHAQLAQDAAVEVEQNVGMRGVDRPVREEVVVSAATSCPRS